MDLCLLGGVGFSPSDSSERRFSALVISSRKEDGTLVSVVEEGPSEEDPRLRSRLPPAAAAAANSKSVRSDRYKTELCRQFSEGGSCRYGDKCQFAHGADERRAIARHPKYKTSLCRTFHSTGFCPYGARCHFIHGEIGAKDSDQKWRRVTPDSQVVTGDRQVSCDSLMRSIDNSSIRIHRLIETLMNNNQSVTDSSYSIHEQTTATCFSPSIGSWSSAHLRPSGSMESTSASPTLSCSDSPSPSPTSMLPDEDIWASLASIIGVGL